ncbi:MAG TPA: aromatic ring-hydroxylating dioxygenase subunit alpha [Thermoanaerobaculia bacterium]|nr:aromatic ring-hydroxylating dioxygenase subunit alpha [Thermoanaerobaculia bacterium]
MRRLPPDPTRLDVAADIGGASTLPGSFYGDPALHELAKERIFARSWQWLGEESRVRVPGAVWPQVLLPGCLDEPVLVTRDRDDRLHVLSNVCTHRGARVCEGEGTESVLRCRYHGRRFALDGSFLSMPEFDGVSDFPSDADDLPKLALGRWRQFLFTSLAPAFSFEELVAEVEARVGWLPIAEATFLPERSRDYLVEAHWALYCDNYLEGFHVPFVHAGLAASLDVASYRTELFRWSNLQVGVARGGEDSFDLPASSPDHGQSIAAYYFWLFPNLMLNFYPWGLSVNLVQPLAADRTRVSFLTFAWDPQGPRSSGVSALDRVEREDEAVVESVQVGVRSRLYGRGRYSPTQERGVHHFHRLLSAALAGGSAA